MPPVAPRRLILAGVAAHVISWGLSVVVISTWPGYDQLSQNADDPLTSGVLLFRSPNEVSA
ncbi:MAG: hypothetical protein ABIQ17_04230 [Candidatus Limnocylindrales bacterium]